MSLLKTIGNIAGAAVGGYFGGPLGAAAGSQFGNMLGPSEERMANRQYVQQKRDAIAFWNMQNEYNSPVAQMQRLKEAGLNPMLVYGSGSVDGNSTSAPSVPSYPQVRSGRSGGVSSAVEKFFLNKSMENAEDQSRANALNEEYLSLRNDLMRAKTQNELTRRNKPDTDNSMKDLINETRLAILQKQLSNLEYGVVNGNVSNVNTWLSAFAKLRQKAGKSLSHNDLVGVRDPDSISNRPRFDNGLLMNPW